MTPDALKVLDKLHLALENTSFQRYDPTRPLLGIVIATKRIPTGFFTSLEF